MASEADADRLARQTIRTYVVMNAASTSAFLMIFATYTSYLLDRGLTLFEVHALNAMFALAVVLLEVPTGLFADIKGRKRSVLAGFAIDACGFATYALGSSMAAYVAAELLLALGHTLISGAFEAWAVDRLKRLEHKEPLERIFAKKTMVSMSLGMFGALAGGFLAEAHIALPFGIASGILLCGLAYGAIAMREDRRTPERPKDNACGMIRSGYRRVKDAMRSGVRHARQSKRFALLLLIVIVPGAAFKAPDLQWQPLFLQFGTSKATLGIIGAVIMLCLIAGAAFSRRVDFGSFRGKVTYALVCLTGCGVCIVACGLSGSFPTALGGFIAYELFRGAWSPVHRAAINEAIEGDERATLLSFESIAYRGASLPGHLAFGGLAAAYGVGAAWMLSGGFLAFACGLMLILLPSRCACLKAVPARESA